MADDWYYSVGDQRSGPVSPAELKRVADAGHLQPTDLVWKDGMAQWVQARAVKGLFANALPVGAAATVAAPIMVSESTPSRRWPGRKPGNHDWHPFDLVVDAARKGCPVELADTIATTAGAAGVYGLYSSAALVLFGGVLLAVRTNMLGVMLFALGASIAVLVGQYVANRLLGALRGAIAANKIVLGSLAIPDSVFVIASVVTIGHGARCLYEAIQTRMIASVVEAVAILVVGAFTALVAITPRGLGVEVDPKCRAGQEAVGVLAFLFKLALRCTPLVFAAGVIYVTYQLVTLTYAIITSDVAGLDAIMGRVAIQLLELFTVLALPLVAYMLMLVYYLLLDVIMAIVSLPGRVDALATRLTDQQDR